MKNNTNPVRLGNGLRIMHTGQMLSVAAIIVSILSVIVFAVAMFGATGSLLGAYGSIASGSMSGFTASAFAAIGGIVIAITAFGVISIGLCILGAMLGAYGSYMAKESNPVFASVFYVSIAYIVVSVLRLACVDNIIGMLCSIAAVILPMVVAVMVGYAVTDALSVLERTGAHCNRVREVTADVRKRYIRFGIFAGVGIALLMIGLVILVTGNFVFSGILLVSCLVLFIMAGYMWVRALLLYLRVILRESQLVCEAIAAHVLDADIQPTVVPVTRVAKDGTVTETVVSCGGSDNAEKE